MYDSLLWEHQIKAISKAKEYIKDYNSKLTMQSALIQMPTGSGKSGVIAVLSRLINYSGIVIILTPRISLREQITRDISARFFNNIDYTGVLYKEVIEIICGNEVTLDRIKRDPVFVMTLQMLNSLSVNDEIFEKLSNQCSLILIDEGHYEPAKDWSKVVRKILAPKILFTATPYRNDYKIFDVDKEYTYFVSLNECVKKNYLRNIEIIQRNKSFVNKPMEFIDDIISFYEEKFSGITDDRCAPRIIIQCSESASIRQLAEVVKAKGYTVLGIHETFDETIEWERKKVPIPNSEKAIFWIHQYKLIEGIDDSRFQILALFCDVRNARSLVQQIGRIIRNPKRNKESIGYVLDYSSEYHESLWNNYLLFDKEINSSSDNINLAFNNNILEKLIEDQPKVTYIDGRFRSKLEIENINPEKDIKVPLKVNIFLKDSNFDLTKYLEALAEEYKDKDYIYSIYNINEKLAVALTITYENSDFLNNHVFIEPKLNVFIIYEMTKFICIYNSNSIIFEGNASVSFGKPIHSSLLKKIFNDEIETRITTVSLSNTNIGTSSIRSRAITAVSMQSTIPGFDDYAQVCTAAEGYSEDDASKIISPLQAKRYIGFSNGTIIQRSNKYHLLNTYVNWLNCLQKILEGKQNSTQVLSRYALEKNIPTKSKPQSILLDSDIQNMYVLIRDRSEFLEIEDKCCKVTNGNFYIKANEKKYNFKIDFSKDKYILSCKELEQDYCNFNKDIDIIRYINKTQSFSIVPEDNQCIYVNGYFYNPKFKIGKKFDKDNYELGQCFITDSIVGNCNTEKGYEEYYRHNNEKWDPESLFGIISTLGKKTSISSKFGNPDIIVCDDGSTEIADFILCDTVNQKVVFIHAKAKETKSHCSASSMHEVCSQAVKNLGYLAMFNDFKPSKLKTWDGNWSAKVSSKKNKKNNSMGEVNKRIYKSSVIGADNVWKEIHKCINNPVAEKEVWIVLGNVFSKQEFETRLGKSKPAAFALHAAYLLNATMSDVASVGAKFRIICDL